MDYERKYLKYKKKYLYLKKQVGGQRTVNIYDKANYRNLLYTIDLDEGDDIDILKNKILEINNKKGITHILSIDEINIHKHEGFCVGQNLAAITDSMNNFCISIIPVRKFSPIPMRSGLVPSLAKKSFTNTSFPQLYLSKSIIDGDEGEFDGTVNTGYHLDNETHIELVDGYGTYKSLRRDLSIQTSLDGHFLNDKLVEGKKKVITRDIDTKEFVGTFVNNNLVNGEITIFGPNRIILEKQNGNFDDNEQLIEGTITRRNGQIERGNFKNNLLQGQGSITYPDGRILSGIFVNGVLQGNIKLSN